MHDCRPLLTDSDFPTITRQSLEILQVNLGYLCNQSCVHCHVNAGPKRTESMPPAVIDQLLALLDANEIHTLDLTGGAPEMHPQFQDLVRAARQRGVKVIDRCNLTILEVKAYAGMAEFLAENQVEITASLPCYLEENVDKQRGKGVFKDSIAALQRLNRLGYAQIDCPLQLNLVYNPQEPVLPPAQQGLEQAYKQQLNDEYGIRFNKLFAIANMPINRFGSQLISQGRFAAYMDLLRTSYRAENLKQLMCLNTISIDWQGYVYDCDFNQMLDMPILQHGQQRAHIRNLQLETLSGQTIATAAHCYGCTAGQGSSCGGALQEN
jgi:radical SAM/Cys-rich protein